MRINRFSALNSHSLNRPSVILLHSLIEKQIIYGTMILFKCYVCKSGVYIIILRNNGFKMEFSEAAKAQTFCYEMKEVQKQQTNQSKTKKEQLLKGH